MSDDEIVEELEEKLDIEGKVSPSDQKPDEADFEEEDVYSDEDVGSQRSRSARSQSQGSQNVGDEYDYEEEFEDDYEEDEGQEAVQPRRSVVRKKGKKKRKKRRKKKKKKKKKMERDLDDEDNEEDYYNDDDYFEADEEFMERGGSSSVSWGGRYSSVGSEPDRFAAVRIESARIMSKRFMERHEVKQRMLDRRAAVHRRMINSKKKKEAQWRRKMERSPFLVDLLAENERIDEENRVRLEEEARRERMLQRRKANIKNEIILKALGEASDLDALRQEKRLIAVEEKRLKALLTLEKSKGHRKADLLAAQRAERQRKQVQAEYRRQKLREETKRRAEVQREILREKLAVKPDEAFTYFSRTLG
eukprot:g1453.t1